ncbi:uncharacterized protein LOC115709061 isoform X1 [Cannabis sativa]|uniref:uncharacterized protein LOC115709061 isoform X1 n=1 Tax=Cannabis sativa TaxID=3483 RepID=UPI0029CA9A62|nr:uncharacterized protein LOC115709061 isoform X1 [Cannabis sativa]
MSTTVALTGEPILSKLDRLDNMLRELEEINKGSNRSCSSPSKSSYESTQSSGTLTSEGHVSSIDDVSPRSLEKHCRPINHVVLEAEVKGNLIERLHRVEDRVLKLCLQMEEELIKARKMKEKKKSHTKKGLKQLVQQCVGGTKNSDLETHQ